MLQIRRSKEIMTCGEQEIKNKMQEQDPNMDARKKKEKLSLFSALIVVFALYILLLGIFYMGIEDSVSRLTGLAIDVDQEQDAGEDQDDSSQDIGDYQELQEGTAIDVKTAESQTYPSCEHPILGQINESALAGCEKYIANFSLALDANNLDIDPLLLMAIAKHETNCRTNQELQEEGISGGIMQSEGCDVKPDECTDVSDQINSGVTQFAKVLDLIEKREIKGKDALYLAFFGYKRGSASLNDAFSYINQGLALSSATQKACIDNHINLPDYSYEKYCQLEDATIGIYYADQVWPIFKKACEDINGTIPAPETVFKEAYDPGPYSVKPNFYVETGYDFSIYEEAARVTKRFDECHADIQCVLDATNESRYFWIVKQGGAILTKNFVGEPATELWQEHCESEEDFALNSFAEAASLCADARDSDCVCEFPTENWINIKLDIKEENDARQVCAGSGCLPLKERIVPDRLNYGNYGDKIILYKSQSGTEIVEPRFYGRYNETERCIANKQYLKFCVIGTDKLKAYDPEREEYKERLQAIRFAYFFKAKITDVENITVYDERKAENSVIVSWDAIRTADVENYTIIYSDDINIEEQKTEELLADEEKMQKVKSKSFNTKNTSNLFSIGLEQEPECDFDEATGTCDFYYAFQGVRIELEKNRLYHVLSRDRYFVLLDGINDSTDYYYGVFGIDEDGERSPETSKPTSKEQSVDDLEPAIVDFIAKIIAEEDGSEKIQLSWIPPAKNIDGSERKDELRNYKIYCSGAETADTTQSLFPTVENAETVLGDYTPGIDFNDCLELPIEQHRFAIIATDKNGNAFSGLINTQGFE